MSARVLAATSLLAILLARPADGSAQSTDAGAPGASSDCPPEAWLGSGGGGPRVACARSSVGGAAVTAMGSSTALTDEHGDLVLEVSTPDGTLSVSVDEIRTRTQQEAPVRIPERLRVAIASVAPAADVARVSITADYGPDMRHEYVALVRVSAGHAPTLLWSGDGDYFAIDCPDDWLCGCATERTVTVRVRGRIAQIRSRITHDLSRVHSPDRRHCDPLPSVRADVPLTAASGR